MRDAQDKGEAQDKDYVFNGVNLRLQNNTPEENNRELLSEHSK